MASDPSVEHVLAVLRASVDALSGLGDDAPDLLRLRSTLQALHPALAGKALGEAAFDPVTGMPAPSWLAAAASAREAVLASREPDPPEEAISAATALDPELTTRLIAERTFRRFLRRHELFPPPGPRVSTLADGTWWVWDHLLADGRWGRIRVAGSTERRPQPGDTWFTLPFDDLEAEVGYDLVVRCILGPVWMDAAGRAAGLLATREASGENRDVRLALDRELAEEPAPPGAVVVPFALPRAG